MLYRQIALGNVKLFCFIVYENIVGEVEIVALYKKSVFWMLHVIIQ